MCPAHFLEMTKLSQGRLNDTFDTALDDSTNYHLDRHIINLATWATWARRPFWRAEPKPFQNGYNLECCLIATHSFSLAPIATSPSPLHWPRGAEGAHLAPWVLCQTQRGPWSSNSRYPFCPRWKTVKTINPGFPRPNIATLECGS